MRLVERFCVEDVRSNLINNGIIEGVLAKSWKLVTVIQSVAWQTGKFGCVV